MALCCPSRAALLRGQHAHNTNITNVVLPGGSFTKFQASGEDANNLPHYLNRAGYRTEYAFTLLCLFCAVHVTDTPWTRYIGKIMNGYANWNYDTPPSGWDRFDGMLDPWMYTYNTPVFSVNGATPRYYNGSYLQDVVHAKAVDRVENLIANETASGQPWFLMVAPTHRIKHLIPPAIGLQCRRPVTPTSFKMLQLLAHPTSTLLSTTSHHGSGSFRT